MKVEKYNQYLIKMELEREELDALRHLRNGVKSLLIRTIVNYVGEKNLLIVDAEEVSRGSLNSFWELKLYTADNTEIKVGYTLDNMWIHVSASKPNVDAKKIANEILKFTEDCINVLKERK